MTDPKFTPAVDLADIATYIEQRLTQHLSGARRVLWLLSGGSVIAAEAMASAALLPELRAGLVVAQVDERYGPPGHRDSNWQQLQVAGLQFLPALAHPVLTGKPFDETVRAYNHTIEQLLEQTEITIGVLGVGADGHTAGILPHSPAAQSHDLVAGYQGPDFQRITITARVIEQLDEAIVWAAGEAKQPQLAALKRSLPAEDQPAQLLKRAKSLTIFGDTPV